MRNLHANSTSLVFFTSRFVSGTRVAGTGKKAEVAGKAFANYGAHQDAYPHVYLTAAAALGGSTREADEFCRRFCETIKEVVVKAAKQQQQQGQAQAQGHQGGPGGAGGNASAAAAGAPAAGAGGAGAGATTSAAAAAAAASAAAAQASCGPAASQAAGSAYSDAAGTAEGQ